MVDYLKEIPEGIDKPIQQLQVELNESLQFDKSYGRVYTNLRQDNGKTIKIPEAYIGNKEYKEVLLNDEINGHFFFVEHEKSRLIHSQTETEVDIIFLMNLEKLLPSVQHRADEEMRMKIVDALEHNTASFEIDEMIKGRRALEDFDHKLLDMQPFHFLKITGKIKYQFKC